jgi:beta-lactamase regulating signal transducer with metallopeptidase domain
MIALSMVAKASVLFGLAGILDWAWRHRASAATRHLMWTTVVVAVLLLPIASFVSPEWTLAVPAPAAVPRAAPIVTADAAPDQTPIVDARRIAPPEFSVDARTAGIAWPVLLAILYAVGVLAVLGRLGAQCVAVRRLARRAIEVHDPAWTNLLTSSARVMGVDQPVRLIRSRQRTMPMTFGTRTPSILIPAASEAWSDDRRRAVVLHELAHVVRPDCLTQSVALVACALYWFHPAAWWVARRLRIEREFACDDRVIEAGTEARDYAAHLLEIAYSFDGQRAPAIAVSMARPHQLEGRMLAVLDATRNRRLPAFGLRVAALVVAAAVILALGGAKPIARAAEPTDSRADNAWTASPVQSSSALQGQAESGPDGIGTWELRPADKDGLVHLRISERNSSSGFDTPRDRFEGLTTVGGPVSFKLRRDAGTFTFEGVVHNGVGAGTFSFAPDPAFPVELAKRGFAKPTLREQYQLARGDVGYAFLDELNTQGYAKPDTAGLVRAAEHGVQATYLSEMGTLGYRLGSLDALMTLRDHGVTPTYIRELADFGYTKLPAADLVKARDHGVSPEYVRTLRDNGYRSLPMDQLVNLRDHGVSAEFIQQMGDAGYRQQTIDELVRMRDHGISPQYVRDMAALGYTRLSLDELVRLRDHGVSPEYTRDVKALGYDKLTIEDLVMLRDHGLTPDRIRVANSRAGTHLTLDGLRSMADRGIR